MREGEEGLNTQVQYHRVTAPEVLSVSGDANTVHNL